MAPLLLAGWQLGAVDHSVQLVNRTGKTANDLHVTFAHKTGNPSCTPMTNTAVRIQFLAGGVFAPFMSNPIEWFARAYPLLMGSRAGSKSPFYRAP